MKALRTIVLSLLPFLCLASSATAQIDVNLAQGLEPYKSYMGGNLDSVSLTNGNLMLHIPFVSYPQRGGRLSLGFYLRYNNKNFGQVFNGTVSWGFDGAGVDVQRDDLWEPRQQKKLFSVPGDNGTAHPLVVINSVITPDGSFHDLGWKSGGWGFNAGPIDGSALGRHGIQDQLVSSNPIPVDPSCTNAPISFWNPIVSQDPNGNQIITSSLGWTDTLGRVIPGTAACPRGFSTFGAEQGVYAGGDGAGTEVRMLPGASTADFTGCPANTVSARVWLLPAFGNSSIPSSATATMRFCYANFVVSSDFTVSGVNEVSNSTFTMLQNVILPNGTSWSFNYSSRGDLSNVTFPTGGSISYTWGHFHFCTSYSRALTSRTVDANDGTGPHTWNYAWTPGVWNQSVPGGPPPTTVVVTDPAGNDSVHVSSGLEGCNYYETHAAYYQGSQASGTLQKQVDTGYTVFDNPTAEYSYGSPGAAFPTTITTTWANGKVTIEQTDYDTPTTYTAWDLLCYNCSSMPQGTTQTRINGQVAAQSVFDYGNGGPGPLLRKAATSYFTLDDPSSVITYDGNGNKCAETDFAYDDPARLVASGVTMMHGTPYAGAVRANASSSTRWLTSTPCSSSATWSQISSYSNYFDTGELASSTDALGNATSYSYAPTFYGAYLTSTQLPDTSTAGTTMHHKVSGDYDFNTGLLRTFTNQNGNSSTYLYDNIARITSGSFADGGQLVFNYPDANTVEKKQLQSAGTWIDQFVYFDGLGRKKQTQLKDPEGDDFTDTTYDAMGRVAVVTNPHRSTSSSTDGTTTTAYDAFGRVASITRPDGGVAQTSYSDPTTVTLTDETGRQRLSISDALGRLIEVDEPGGGAAGTAASGGLTITGTLQTKSATTSTPGTGSLTFTGNEQSKPGAPATIATGAVTIQGAEQSTVDLNSCRIVNHINVCNTVYDHGTVYLTVNGVSASCTYSQTSNTTSTAMAGCLASAITNATNSPVAATGSGSTINMTSRVAGSSGNYAFSVTSNWNTVYFSSAAYSGSPASGNLSGGTDAGPTIYDAGTCTVAINGTQYSKTFGQGDTTSTIASGLAGVISGGSLASATASGATISLTAKSGGTASNYSLTSSCSYNSSNFSGPSFTESASGSTLTGGTNGSAAATDAGTVQMSVGGYSATANYGNGTGQDSIATAVASDLAAKIQAQLPTSNPSFTISSTGASININWSSVGSAGNVTVNTTSATTQTSYFSTPSFASCAITTNPQNCSAALSGGADPGPGSLNTPYVTLYAYDTLNNLLRVDQKGSAPSDSTQWRTRLFTYDSLSRLTQATNPESGTIKYAYDNNGNLLQKTSPAANQTGSATETVSYCYDALNRVTGWAYTAQSCPLSSPPVSYAYDAGANGIGHLTSLTDQAGSAAYAYDVQGRMAAQQRTINPPAPLAAVSKTISYAYNLDGSLNTLTYPSGAVLTYTPDSAGRMLSAVDAGNAINYVTSATYGPHSALTGFLSGKTGSFAGITNSFSFNKRLQPVFMSASVPSQTVFSIGYDFHLGAGDNGNVWGIVNNKDTTRNQTFTYDSLNRLTSAQNAGSDCSVAVGGKTKFWGNNYGYDAWGNLLSKSVTKCSAENLIVSADPQNRMHAISGQDYQYDAAGNLTFNATPPVATYAYDAENRITGAAGYNYVYDGDGNRVEKTTGGSSPSGTLYWYMSPGIVAESDLLGNPQSEYVFFDGERVARKDFPSNAVSYYFSDHLKTASVITDAAGNIKSESDYYPWGGELQFTNNDSNHYKFTGKERDNESGLDYFGARYYSNGLGRFISADWSATPVPVPYATLENPQSLNLYSYVLANPLGSVDLDGHACSILLGNTGSGFCQRAAEYRKIDAEVRNQTRFFAGASAVSTVLASADASFGEFAFSKHTGDVLELIGHTLEKINLSAEASIKASTLSGPELDAQLVHMEQTQVQNLLDYDSKVDPGYGNVIREINAALNPTGLEKTAGRVAPTDRAFAKLLDDVRKQLGHNIDFASQGDREAMGNAVIDHIRRTGGRDILGGNASSQGYSDCGAGVSCFAGGKGKVH